MKHNRSEKGQALIMMTIGIVVFMGFVALALDGGMVYTDRRTAQNAADSASLAGGGAASLSLENSHIYYSTWDCNSAGVSQAQTAAVTAAQSRATTNDFTIDSDVSDKNGVTISCGSEDVGGFTDRYMDITVQISTTSRTNFIQLFSSGVIHNNVEAITRVRPRSPAVFGNAVVALNPDGCLGMQDGAMYHGGGSQDVRGGGIWSNGCLRFSGGPTVNVTDGTVHYVKELDVTGGNGSNPPPEKASQAMPPSAYAISAPNCDDPKANNVSNLPTTLTPGLWCYTGKDLPGGLQGAGVTIYVKSTIKSLWNGRDNTQLSAPAASPDPSPALAGVLLYMDASNKSELVINGNSTTKLTGTLYMPGATLSMLGTGNTDAYHTQIIAWNVEVGGTADNGVVFQEQQQFSMPTSLELFK